MTWAQRNLIKFVYIPLSKAEEKCTCFHALTQTCKYMTKLPPF